MEMILYNCTSSSNTINKDLTEVERFNIRLKKSTDIYNPSIPISSDIDLVVEQVNYCYISGVDRYYFIDSLNPYPNKIYRLSLRVDVLESFKNDILNSLAVVNKSNELGYLSTSINHEFRKEVTIFESDVTLSKEKSLIMTTLGG